MSKSRLQSLQTQLKPHSALLLTNHADIQYFSSYSTFLVPQTREGFLLISRHSATVIYPHMSPILKQSGFKYSAGCSLKDLVENVKVVQQREKILHLDIDENTLFADEFLALKAISKLKIGALNRQIIWQLRMFKDETEIKLMKSAAKLTQQVVTEVSADLHSCISELELANRIDQKFREAGARPAFPTIVAFNQNSALPHHQPGNDKLQAESAVLIDCGAELHGYKSDISRTFWFGKKPLVDFQLLEKTVKTAYQAALAELKKKFVCTELTVKTLDELSRGLSTKLNEHLVSKNQLLNVAQNQTLIEKTRRVGENQRSVSINDQKISGEKAKELTAAMIDRAAREVIKKAGYGPEFIHTTGHGLGLEIHEPPSLNSQNRQPLLANMLITIEPGIYLTGQFGYRHENTILLTAVK